VQETLEVFEYYLSYWKGVNPAVLDMSMPDMNGWELSYDMKNINTDMKAILSSGRESIPVL